MPGPGQVVECCFAYKYKSTSVHTIINPNYVVRTTGPSAGSGHNELFVYSCVEVRRCRLVCGTRAPSSFFILPSNVITTCFLYLVAFATRFSLDPSAGERIMDFSRSLGSGAWDCDLWEGRWWFEERRNETFLLEYFRNSRNEFKCSLWRSESRKYLNHSLQTNIERRIFFRIRAFGNLRRFSNNFSFKWLSVDFVAIMISI